MKSRKQKSSKTYILAALIISLTRNFTMAQSGGCHGDTPIPDFEQIKEMIAKLSKELSLSEEQEAQISAICFAHFEEVKQKIKSGRPNRAEMEAISSEFENEMKSVLAIEQQKLFVAFTVTPENADNSLAWTISGAQGTDWSLTAGALDQASITVIWQKPGTYTMTFTETERHAWGSECFATRNLKVTVNDNCDVVIEDATANCATGSTGTTDVTFGLTKQMVQAIGHSIILQQFLLLQ